MLNRRQFLTTGMVGAGLAATPGLAAACRTKPEETPFSTNSFDEKWAQADLEHLGAPRSWWHVHQGLHPFSPERVLVIQGRPSDWQYREVKNRLLEQGFGRDKYFSEEKLDYAISIMHRLTWRYGLPECFEDWATRLAAREHLGTILGHWGGCGIVHQFQRRDQPIRTQNGLVDWWLFLIPAALIFKASTVCLPTSCWDAWMPMGRSSVSFTACATSDSS